MANHKSALKRILQNEKRRVRNKGVKSRLRTRINQFNAAVEAGDLETAQKTFVIVSTALDRAASKGVIPKARASRKTSRLALKLNSLG